jgi:hypothetical protein
MIIHVLLNVPAGQDVPALDMPMDNVATFRAEGNEYLITLTEGHYRLTEAQMWYLYRRNPLLAFWYDISPKR